MPIALQATARLRDQRHAIIAQAHHVDVPGSRNFAGGRRSLPHQHQRRHEMARILGTWLAAAALALGLVGCAGMGTDTSSAGTAKAAGAKPGVVIQVSDGDPKTWTQALNVVRNVQNAYGMDKVDIELVVFGNGIGLLEKDSPQASRISETTLTGAKVLMCENTMAGRKKTKADMLPDIGYVKAGVIEIIEKSQQGWAVVRP
jgi:intracellular sulfur oxidation DsrE/DsrF family protein